MPEDPTDLPRRRSTDNLSATVDMFRFLAELSDIGARTNVLERAHEELRKEVREGTSLMTGKINTVEQHLASQDTAVAQMRSDILAQHGALMRQVKEGIDEAVVRATSQWDSEHAVLIGLGRSLVAERLHRRESQKVLTRIGVSMIGVASSVLAVLVAGSLNSVKVIPARLYITIVASMVALVVALIVWVAVKQGMSDLNPPEGA